MAVPTGTALAAAAVASACAAVAAASVATLLPLLLYLSLLPPSVLLSPWLSLLLLQLPSLPLLLLLPLPLLPLLWQPLLSQCLLLWLHLLSQLLLLPQQRPPTMEPLDLPGSTYARRSQERQGEDTRVRLGQGLQDVLHRLAH